MARIALTEEERKARKAEAQRRYYEKNREKCIAASLASRAKKPEEHRAVQAEYRERNKDRIKAQQLEYREANRDRINAGTRKWQLENEDRFRAYQRRYLIENREKNANRKYRWRESNRDRARAYWQRWALENADKRRMNEANRRGAIRAGGGKISRDIADRRMNSQRGKCVACRCDLKVSGYHIDHIIPIARGGQHTDRNIQLLCPACNLSKNAKHPVDFMQQNGFLL